MNKKYDVLDLGQNDQYTNVELRNMGYEFSLATKQGHFIVGKTLGLLKRYAINNNIPDGDIYRIWDNDFKLMYKFCGQNLRNKRVV